MSRKRLSADIYPEDVESLKIDMVCVNTSIPCMHEGWIRLKGDPQLHKVHLAAEEVIRLRMVLDEKVIGMEWSHFARIFHSDDEDKKQFAREIEQQMQQMHKQREPILCGRFLVNYPSNAEYGEIVLPKV
jgi:hypothetical protein